MITTVANDNAQIRGQIRQVSIQPYTAQFYIFSNHSSKSEQEVDHTQNKPQLKTND